ncbi:MAG: hypothetical protein AB7P21_01305 [Lautropia sp.]
MDERAKHDPSECAAFDAAGLRRVVLRIECTGTVNGGTGEKPVVHGLGARRGEWPGIAPVQGHRYGVAA